jgi:hypothetical protein
VESPLQGNLHGGFGGGCGETQFGCAPCAYLTESRMPGSEGGVEKHSSAVRSAPTLPEPPSQMPMPPELAARMMNACIGAMEGMAQMGRTMGGMMGGQGGTSQMPSEQKQ